MGTFGSYTDGSPAQTGDILLVKRGSSTLRTTAGSVADLSDAAVEDVAADLADHIADAAGAHAASAVSFTPTGTIAGTTVQTAVAEVATEAAAADTALLALLRAQFTWTLPTGAVAQNFPRTAPLANSTVLATGRPFLVAVRLEAGMTATSATFLSGVTPAGTPANQWAALYSPALALLAVSPDDTSNAWAANTAKTFTFGTPQVIATAGIYYVMLNVTAATPPTLRSAAGDAVGYGIPPILAGGHNANGFTVPGGAPNPAVFTASLPAAVPYVYVS